MASGPYFDSRRGAYRIQWFDGLRWRRPTVYRVRPWTAGSPAPKRVPPEVHAALAAYAEKERAARHNAPADPDRLLADFLADYRAAYAREQAANSLIQLRQAHHNFLAWCEPQKLTKLPAVTPPVCQRYLDARAAQTSRKTGRPITPKRLNQERGLLMGAWTRAVKLGTLAANPWAATEAPGWERDRKRRRHRPSWTPEEFARLVAAARPWLRDLLVLGTQTGLRVSALTALEWSDVEWAKPDGTGFGLVRVRPEMDKSAKGYSVPQSRACHELLFQRFKRRGADARYVLTAARGGKIRVSVADRAIRAAARRAGLPEPTSPNHHCRRTFGRWAVLGHLTGRPVPLYVVSKWMGHSQVSTTMDYLDMTQDESQEWMAERGPGHQDSGGSPSG